MSNIKLFLVVFVLSLPFWLGYNFLVEASQNFFLSKELAKQPILAALPSLTAQIELKTANFEIEPCFYDEIQAKALFSALVNKQNKEKILFEKQPESRLAIASLTKLLTAAVSAEFYQQTENITVSAKAVNQLENFGGLKVGEVLRPNELLYIMLIESSNDAAFALSELVGSVNSFADLMNLKAKEIGMGNSVFYNPTGLDPDDLKQPASQINLSTAKDLALLGKYLLFNHPEIIETLGQNQYALYSQNGALHHVLKNTNELLGQNPYIVGGKTGFSSQAGGCLFLILKASATGDYIINVILNSPDRFKDMEKLNNCSLAKTLLK